MRVNRGFLGWGIFFIVLGLVPLSVRMGWVSGQNLTEAWRLWPLFLVAAGVGLVLRRTPLEALGGILAAATGGLLLGSLLAVGPTIGVACGPASSATTVASTTGTLSEGASVSLQAACAKATAHAGPGNAWQVAWGPAQKDQPRISSDPSSLEVVGPGGSGNAFGIAAGSTWDVTIPAGVTRAVTMEVDAGTARAPLDGLALDGATIHTNASDVRVDLGGSSVGRIDGEVNVGSLRVGLPASGLAGGRLGANLSSLVICAPAGLGVRIYAYGSLVSWDLPGLMRDGPMYETPGFAAAGGATLRVDANLSSVRLEWGGTCR